MFEDERRIAGANRLIPMVLLIVVIMLLLVDLDPAPVATGPVVAHIHQ